MSKTKGQTIVEITLILPLLLLLVGAALDWGLLFFVSHVAQNAVREGARWAVTRADPNPNPGASIVSKSAVVTQVNSRIPQTPLFSDFRSNVDVSCVVISGKPFIKVQTTGTFSYYFLRLIGFTPATITRFASLQYERSATDCPLIS